MSQKTGTTTTSTRRNGERSGLSTAVVEWDSANGRFVIGVEEAGLEEIEEEGAGGSCCREADRGVTLPGRESFDPTRLIRFLSLIFDKPLQPSNTSHLP